jgi:hypothetical protein
MSGSNISFASAGDATSEVQLSVTTDKTDVKQGDVITVTVNIDSFTSALPNGMNANKWGVTGIEVGVPINTNLFTVTGYSDTDTFLSNDLGQVNFNAEEKAVKGINQNNVPFFHTGDTNIKLFTFKLTVNQDLSADALNESLNCGSVIIRNMYYDNNSGKTFTYNSTESKVNVHAIAPQISLTSDSTPTGTTYDNNVTVGLDKGTATVKKDGTEVASLDYNGTTKTYVATDNATYAVEATDGYGHTSTKTFTVKQGVKSIAVKTKPTKLNYFIGTDNSLDLTGGELTVTYNNNSTATVAMTATGVTTDTVDLNTAATNKAVTVNYSGKSTTYNINVVAKEVSSFTLEGCTGLETVEGKKLAITSGMKANVSYNDGSTGVVALTDAMLEYNYTTVATTVPVKVTIGNKTIENAFSIKVSAKKLSKLELTTYPKKLFKEGESFTMAGGKLTAYYDNDTSEVVNMTDDMIYGTAPDMTKLDVDQIVYVAYGSKVTAYTIKVESKVLSSIEIKTTPSDLEYIEGQDLDITGGKVTIKYDNNTSKDLDLSDSAFTITGYNKNSVSNQTVTVSYTEKGVTKTTTFAVTVKAKSVTGIALKSAPTNTTVLEGKTLSLAGGAITVNYDNGTHEDLGMDNADVTVTGFDSAVTGPQTLTVNYKGKTTTFGVTVTPKSLSSITIVSKPSTLTYLAGKTFSSTGLSVKANFDNDTDADVTSNVTLSGYDMNTAGTQTVTVSYVYGSVTKTATFSIEVKSRAALDIVLNELSALQTKVTNKTLASTDKTAVAKLRTDYNALTDLEKAEMKETDVKAVEDAMNAVLFPEIKDRLDAASGFTMNANQGSVSMDAVFDLKKPATDFDVKKDSSSADMSVLGRFALNITGTTQLNGAVTYTISMADFDRLYAGKVVDASNSLAKDQALKLVAVNADGTYTDLNATFADGKITFSSAALTGNLAVIKVTAPAEDVNGGSTSGDNNTTGGSTASNAQTGDPYPIAILLAMLLASGTIGGLCFFRKRKNAR